MLKTSALLPYLGNLTRINLFDRENFPECKKTDEIQPSVSYV